MVPQLVVAPLVQGLPPGEVVLPLAGLPEAAPHLQVPPQAGVVRVLDRQHRPGRHQPAVPLPQHRPLRRLLLVGREQPPLLLLQVRGVLAGQQVHAASSTPSYSSLRAFELAMAAFPLHLPVEGPLVGQGPLQGPQVVGPQLLVEQVLVQGLAVH